MKKQKNDLGEISMEDFMKGLENPHVIYFQPTEEEKQELQNTISFFIEDIEKSLRELPPSKKEWDYLIDLLQNYEETKKSAKEYVYNPPIKLHNQTITNEYQDYNNNVQSQHFLIKIADTGIEYVNEKLKKIKQSTEKKKQKSVTPTIEICLALFYLCKYANGGTPIDKKKIERLLYYFRGESVKELDRTTEHNLLKMITSNEVLSQHGENAAIFFDEIGLWSVSKIIRNSIPKSNS